MTQTIISPVLAAQLPINVTDPAATYLGIGVTSGPVGTAPLLLRQAIQAALADYLDGNPGDPGPAYVSYIGFSAVSSNVVYTVIVCNGVTSSTS